MCSENLRIGVLGGGGFLGSHLVSTLLEETPFFVQAVDLEFEKLDARSARLEIIEADVSAPGVMEKIVEHCDTIVSTTALCNPSQYNTMPAEVIHASFTHLVPLVQLCTERHRRLIHFSTCEVYGKTHPEPGTRAGVMSEETTDLIMGPIHKERWCYATAKQLLERLIWAHGNHHGLEFSIIRPFNVIGPRMDFIPGVDGDGVPRVLANFMNALLKGKPLPLVDGGRSRRCFMSVADFVKAVLLVIQKRKKSKGKIFNVGNPENDVSIERLANMMISSFENVTQKPFTHGLFSVSAQDFYGQGYEDTKERVPDISKAVRLLGWRPEDALADMLPGIIRDYVQRYSSRLAPGTCCD